MAKKIYIAGCGGMLGEAFYKTFSKDYNLRCSDIDLNEKWLNYLDFRDYKSYLDDVTQYKPNYLIHLGAHTDLEYCELNKDDAYQTNTSSVMHAVSISNELKIYLIEFLRKFCKTGRKLDDRDGK